MKKIVLVLALLPLFAFADGGGSSDDSRFPGEPVSDEVLDSIHGTTSPYVCGPLSESKCLGQKPHSLCIVGNQDNGYIGHCMETHAETETPVPVSKDDTKTPVQGEKDKWSCICR